MEWLDKGSTSSQPEGEGLSLTASAWPLAGVTGDAGGRMG